jgi:hypothetical protein
VFFVSIAFSGVDCLQTNTGRQIVSEDIDIKDIEQDGNNREGKYNECNHWENGKPPDDYHTERDKFKTSRWINALKGGDYKTYRIPESHVVTLLGLFRSAYTTGSNWQTGELSAPADENLIDMLNGEDSDQYNERKENQKRDGVGEPEPRRYFHKDYDKISDDMGNSFLRSEYHSFKSTRSGIDGQTDIRKIYESFVLSDRSHTPLSFEPLDEDIKPKGDLTLYLMPWQKIDKDREFRVFVHENEITAISQQQLYDVNDTLVNLGEEERAEKIKNWCDLIEGCFHEKIKPKVDHVDSYVLDIAIIDRDKDKEEIAYPIELNPFGKEYSSGSALFNWLIHETFLYGGDLKNLHFRYVTKKPDTGGQDASPVANPSNFRYVRRYGY